MDDFIKHIEAVTKFADKYFQIRQLYYIQLMQAAKECGIRDQDIVKEVINILENDSVDFNEAMGLFEEAAASTFDFNNF